MPTSYENETAVEHLINLSKSIPSTSKSSEYHKAIIHGIGEAGGVNAVEHLIGLSKSIPSTSKSSEYHKAIVIALGRAGRIS